MPKKPKPAKPESAEPSPPAVGPTDAPHVTLEYVGPQGHVSHVFGPLEPAARYQANADFAAYLVAQHPDFWQTAEE